MSHVTTKWGFIVPDEADADDVPSWIDQLSDALDTKIVGWATPDTWANRPTGAAVIDGLVFWATDQGQMYLAQGGVLHAISPPVGLVGDITNSAFGDAAGAGASGRFADAAHRHGREANPLTAHLSAGDPHTQYALDTDLTPISASAAAAAASASEARLQRIMQPGQSCAGLRMVSGSIGSGVTVSALTVPAGRLYVVKSIDMSGPDAANGGTVQTVECWRQGMTFNFFKNLPVNPNASVAIDCAIILVAAEVLRLEAVNAGGGMDYIISYADLVSTELPMKLVEDAVSTVAAGFVTAYTAPAGNGIVITEVLLCNERNVPSKVSLLANGHTPIWKQPIPANGLLTFDSPIFLAAGQTLQFAVYDADNSVSLHAFGYPAQS